jgi:UDP-N-acetylmuramyl pentapeptide phosphotransferase/UDP-N-acetylglucosamine-1-phosphate transferase
VEIIAIAFITSFLVVLISTPSLIKVAKLKHLVDEPKEERKHHRTSIPTIGGIIIFAATLFSVALWIPSDSLGYRADIERLIRSYSEFKYITAALLILFFIGIKDDIIGTAPVKKLVGHILVAFILVMMADVRITSMYGLFGLGVMPHWMSVGLSVFTYIVIVNAFNLIDGVDGLAGGVGLLCAIFFGIWFFLADNMTFAILGFVLGGSLLGFLIFNFSPARIFMGDSGSLVIGAIVSVLAIRMIETPLDHVPEMFRAVSKPVLAMAVLVYPLVDTFRVFFYRALRGVSPFSADRNHIHHNLLALGLSDARTVLTLYFFNILTVFAAVATAGWNPTVAWLVLFVGIVALVQIPPFLAQRRNKLQNA